MRGSSIAAGWLGYAVASAQPVSIAATTILDGKGAVLHNARIVIENSRITSISPKTGPVDYDLRGLTVLPGWIDAHLHITWIFGKDGKNAGTEGTSQYDAYQAASNAWVTLMAGFTTVQSVGAPNDIPLRDAIAKGIIPGPRILTANEPLEGRGEATGTPDEIRAYVRKQKQAGADLIVTSVGDEPVLPEPYRARYLPITRDELRARIKNEPKGVVRKRLDDGTRLTLVYAKDVPTLLHLVEGLEIEAKD